SVTYQMAGPCQIGATSRLDGLKDHAVLMLGLAGASFAVRQLEMGQRFEGRRHHVEDRTLLVAEDLLRYFERGLRAMLDQVEHLGLAIAMVLDELVGAMPMVAIDAAVG